MSTRHANSRNSALMFKNGTEALMENDKKVDQLLRQVLGLDENQVITEEFSAVRQEMKLRLYPREYVAYTDTWRAEGEAMQLVDRTVLFHDASIFKVQEFIASVPEEQRRAILIDYIDVPLQTAERNASFVVR